MEKHPTNSTVDTESKTQSSKATKTKSATTTLKKEKQEASNISHLDLNKPIELDKDKTPLTTIPKIKTDKRSKIAKFLNLRQKEKKELPADIKKYRKWAWTGYILFFIPLLINRKNEYMRLHANEGLDTNIIDALGLTLLLLGTNLKSSLIFWQSAFLSMFFFGVGLLFMSTVTKIFMIIQSIRGKKKQTPWLWKMRLIKKLDNNFEEED